MRHALIAMLALIAIATSGGTSVAAESAPTKGPVVVCLTCW
jgi:hypothetical protein